MDMQSHGRPSQALVAAAVVPCCGMRAGMSGETLDDRDVGVGLEQVADERPAQVVRTAGRDARLLGPPFQPHHDRLAVSWLAWPRVRPCRPGIAVVPGRSRERQSMRRPLASPLHRRIRCAPCFPCRARRSRRRSDHSRRVGGKPLPSGAGRRRRAMQWRRRRGNRPTWRRRRRSRTVALTRRDPERGPQAACFPSREERPRFACSLRCRSAQGANWPSEHPAARTGICWRWRVPTGRPLPSARRPHAGTGIHATGRRTRPESPRGRRSGRGCSACRRGRGRPRGRRGRRRPDSRPPSRPDPRRGPGTGDPRPAGRRGGKRVQWTSAVSGCGRFLFRTVVLINDLRTPRDRVLSSDSNTTSPGSSCLANRIATVRRCFAKLKVFMSAGHCRGGCRKMAAVVREHGLGQAEKRAAARVNSVPSHECFRIRCIVLLPSKKDCQNALWTSSGVAGGDGSPVMEVRGAEPQLVDHWRGR